MAIEKMSPESAERAEERDREAAEAQRAIEELYQELPERKEELIARQEQLRESWDGALADTAAGSSKRLYDIRNELTAIDLKLAGLELPNEKDELEELKEELEHRVIGVEKEEGEQLLGDMNKLKAVRMKLKSIIGRQ